MSFRSTPLFAGDLYDTALRLAQEDVSKPSAAQEGAPSTNWQQMLALGWQGVLVAEDDGGVGASIQDLSAIVEAVARHGNDAPLVDRCAVAPVLLSAAKSHPQAAQLLSELMTGEVSVCTALDAGDKGPGQLTAPWLSGQQSLQGELFGIDLSEPATHVLFRARDVASQESVLVLLNWDQFSGRVKKYTGTDGRQYADVALTGLNLLPSNTLLTGVAASKAVSEARQMGALMSCVQTVGAAAAMIELSIEYLNTRQQFGVALSSFQALRHRERQRRTTSWRVQAPSQSRTVPSRASTDSSPTSDNTALRRCLTYRRRDAGNRTACWPCRDRCCSRWCRTGM